MHWKRPLYFASTAALLAVLCSPVFSAKVQSGELIDHPPALGIDLAQVGYQDPSAMTRRSGSVNVSLNFLDSDHVLFSFDPKRMFKRLPDCPPTHDDRLVHVAVLEIPTGKIVKQTDWYLHDSRRYVWAYGSGKLLLRRLNSFYTVDSDLRERLIFTSPKDVLWASVTPDAKQLIVETWDDSPASAAKGKPAPKSHVRIEFIDAETLAVQRVIKSERPVNLEGTSSGFASVTPGASGRVWLVRFGSTEHQRANIARVRSRRAPDVLYLSSNAMLIGRDSMKSTAYSVSAFTVTGNRLWRQRWDSHRYTAVVVPSADGSRFAISTLKLTDVPGSNGEENENSTSEQEGLEQRIQVLNTASGEPVLSVTASPVVVSGQNFSLSPDGRRLAVLQGKTLELYDLPQMSADEEAKYTAVKADVPGLYVPAPEEAKDEPEAGNVFTASDSETESPASDDNSLPSQNSGSNNAADTATATALAPAKAAPASSSPQAAAIGDSSGLFKFKSSTQVVALDVVVVNSKGHPVKGLARQDFVVKEDGKPQSVNYFEEVSGSKPVAVQNSVAEKQLPPNIFTNDSPTPGPNSVTLILYDELNTPMVEQQRAKLELVKFLEHKPKDARFAFCVLSERLQMIQGFTPDESVLIQAAKTQKGSLRYNSVLTQDAQTRQMADWLTIGAMGMLGASTKFTTASRNLLDTAGLMEEQEAEIRSRDLETRMWITMDAFAQMARYLAAIPGRKSLIWLSGSFPLGIFPGVDLRNPNTSSDTYTGQVKQAVNLLAESHIALYPVDVRGLTVYSMLTPSFSNSADSTQPVAPDQSPLVLNSDTKRLDELGILNSTGNIGANLPGGDTPFMEEVTEHGIMDQIAGETGGKAFYNTNGIEQAMSTAMEQEANYYALSYTPTNRKYDGKFRKIKVTLAPSEKGLHVIHRSGYFAVDPNAQGISRDVKTGFGLAAMQHGSPQSHQILFAARVFPLGKPRRVDSLPGQVVITAKKKKKQSRNPQTAEPLEAQRYAIDYALSPAQVRFDPVPDGTRHGVTNFMVTSFDENGRPRTSVVSQATSNLKPEDFHAIEIGGYRLHEEVDVPSKAAFLRLGVQDALTGRMGTVEIPLPVKALAGVEQSSLHAMPPIEPD